jgi:SEC-C motif-containing protein
MRSRYAAYALHLTDYIERTTHPQNEQFNREGLKPFCEQTEFLGLDILDVQEGEASATVTFTAHLAQAGRDASFTEKSLFEKVKGQWMYRAGC